MPIFECYATEDELLDLVALIVDRHDLRVTLVDERGASEFGRMDGDLGALLRARRRFWLLGGFSLRPLRLAGRPAQPDLTRSGPLIEVATSSHGAVCTLRLHLFDRVCLEPGDAGLPPGVERRSTLRIPAAATDAFAAIVATLRAELVTENGAWLTRTVVDSPSGRFFGGRRDSAPDGIVPGDYVLEALPRGVTAAEIWAEMAAFSARAATVGAPDPGATAAAPSSALRAERVSVRVVVQGFWSEDTSARTRALETSLRTDLPHLHVQARTPAVAWERAARFLEVELDEASAPAFLRVLSSSRTAVIGTREGQVIARWEAIDALDPPSLFAEAGRATRASGWSVQIAQGAEDPAGLVARLALDPRGLFEIRATARHPGVGSRSLAVFASRVGRPVVHYIAWADLGKPYLTQAVVGDASATGGVEVWPCGVPVDAPARFLVDAAVASKALRTFIATAERDGTLTWEDCDELG